MDVHVSAWNSRGTTTRVSLHSVGTSHHSVFKTWYLDNAAHTPWWSMTWQAVPFNGTPVTPTGMPEGGTSFLVEPCQRGCVLTGSDGSNTGGRVLPCQR